MHLTIAMSVDATKCWWGHGEIILLHILLWDWEVAEPDHKI